MTLAEMLGLPTENSVADHPDTVESWRFVIAREAKQVTQAVRAGLVSPISLEQWCGLSPFERSVLVSSGKELDNSSPHSLLSDQLLEMVEEAPG